MIKMLLMLLPLLVHQAWSVTVVTTKGPIVGQKAGDGNYTTFLGVPYAKVDERKPFENTLEYPNFSTPFNASDPFIKCPQVIITEGGILQCLRLNIYVPDTGSSNLPVFVWFHGGGLAFGSAGEYNATHLVQAGIIVVTANYRLGPYGFLCTSDIRNQGLKDQKTALKWIKRNIIAFGGDPDKVTIGGESWGASAVDFLLYENDAEFNQAILQSGSRSSFGVSTRLDNMAPIQLAARLRFNTTEYKEAVKFLSIGDPLEVMRVTRDLGLIFGVCEKPGRFLLPEHSHRIANIPILIGYNSKEAFADFATQPESFYKNIGEEFVTNLYKTFDLHNCTLRQLADVIWKFYLGGKSISLESMLEIVDLSSDFRVNYGAERSVSNYLYLKNPKVYKYLFSYTGGSQFKNMTGVGAYHTEELPYLFEWGTSLKTEEQLKMRQWMIKMWTNFIKFSDPTPNHGPSGWLPTNLLTRPYLNIDVESEMRHHVYHQRMAFWDLMWTAYEQFRK